MEAWTTALPHRSLSAVEYEAAESLLGDAWGEPVEVCTAEVVYDVEAQIEPLVMTALGGSYIPEVIELPADDHTAELPRWRRR